MGKHLKGILVVLGIFILVIFIVDKLLLSPNPSTPLAYSTFFTDVQQHKIKKATITGHEIAGDMVDGAKFSTVAPDDRDLYPALRAANVEYTVVNNTSTPLFGYVLQFIPFIIMALLLIFILRQAQSGGS
ncbi:MAG TPA: ATP-dependent metallopeptidase FtsH/Yme1/Tma family protein, partial [Xanthomonadales bacterium]|nr:ATP-dependent metallopeptidase FtsH/Yme1/Tma family protein [Xanthomonadales bacterium]